MTARLRYGRPPQARDLQVEYDACIIGSGASGAVVAHALVRAGCRVLMVERGPFLPDDAREGPDGMAAADVAYVPGPNGLVLRGRPWTTCNVGGGTVFYAGVTFRPREVDFRATPYFPEADLPVDWPFGYDALAPYLDAIERVQGVSGTAWNDPLHPGPESPEHLPALPRTLQGDCLFAAAERLGICAFQTPLAVLSRPLNGRAACEHLTPCDEYRCPISAKGDAFSVFLKPLLAEERLRLFAGLVAVRLVRSREARVNQVETISIRSKERYTFQADAFFLAGNAIQSAALLLRSGDHWEPMGIGNRYGLVGRGLCMKISRYCSGVSPQLATAQAHRGPFSTFATMDFYVHPDCPSGMGGVLYENHLEGMEEPGTLLLEILLADCPRWRNRVYLSGDLDKLGIPRIVIDYTTSPLDQSRLDWMTKRANKLLEAAGSFTNCAIESDYAAGSAHLHGTCRAGDDELTSVVGSSGRVHGLGNLYVVDGGFFPFPTGVNPTLTIQANGLRIAEEFLVQHSESYRQ